MATRPVVAWPSDRAAAKRLAITHHPHPAARRATVPAAVVTKETAVSPANHVQRTPEEQAARDDEQESARAEMKALEEGDSVPSDPADWPSGKAKFLTFGNEGDDAYGDGPTAMIGPAGLELRADGTKVVRAGRPDMSGSGQDSVAADGLSATGSPRPSGFGLPRLWRRKRA